MLQKYKQYQIYTNSSTTLLLSVEDRVQSRNAGACLSPCNDENYSLAIDLWPRQHLRVAISQE